MPLRIGGILALIMSRGFSGDKQWMKFANARNRSQVCLFSQSERTINIIVMQNVQFKFWQLRDIITCSEDILQSLLHLEK